MEWHILLFYKAGGRQDLHDLQDSDLRRLGLSILFILSIEADERRSRAEPKVHRGGRAEKRRKGDIVLFRSLLSLSLKERSRDGYARQVERWNRRPLCAVHAMLGQFVESFEHGTGVVAMATLAADTDRHAVKHVQPLAAAEVDGDASLVHAAAADFAIVESHGQHSNTVMTRSRFSAVSRHTTEMPRPSVLRPRERDGAAGVFIGVPLSKSDLATSSPAQGRDS